MTDLDLIRDFRADVPTPGTARLAAGRARLLTTVRAERPLHRRLPSRPWRLVAMGAAAAAAVAVAVGFLVVPATRPAARHLTGASPSPSASSASVPVTQAEVAARILSTAASTVTRAPVKSEPAPDQWIYHKTVQYGQPGVVSPAGLSTSEDWITFDGSRTAYYQGGQLIVHDTVGGAHATGLSPVAAFNANATPKTAYDAIASLPAAPNALLAAVDKAIAQDGGIASVAAGSPISAVAPKTKGEGEFDYLILLLWNAAGGVGAPSAAQAATFRAMAAIPGVTIQQEVTDAAGAKAIGVSADGGYDQLLLDPVTYQVTGLRQLSTGIGPIEQGPPRGTLDLSLAYATVMEVASPGAR